MAILDHALPIEALATEAGGYAFRDECILGTRMNLVLVAQSFELAHEAAHAVRTEIDRLSSIFDARDPSSELSVLNSSSRHLASVELFAVVDRAEQWREHTRDAFSARLGKVVAAWNDATSEPPRRTLVAELARAAREADVRLDHDTRTIFRPEAVQFALDGFAKGWIVDRAYEIARNAFGIAGALVEIGGEIRCGGNAPDAGGWCIDIADPLIVADNAPTVARAHMSDHAIATSGRGPRDHVVNGVRFSPTLSPRDGWPVAHHISASVISRSAADADALATAMLVAPDSQALALADEHGAVARITAQDAAVKWTALAQAEDAPAHFTATRAREASTQTLEGAPWPEGWQALATFTAPRRQLIRDPEFRSPYMAMWITDTDNRPVRTLLLVGKRADWQKDNFIWWSINRAHTERLVSIRSMSTSGAGVYNVFWDGVNDAGETVPAGTYVLHVETSRERGKHTYRSLTLDFGKFKRFTEVLPPTEEGGGLRVGFDHY